MKSDYNSQSDTVSTSHVWTLYKICIKLVVSCTKEALFFFKTVRQLFLQILLEFCIHSDK